MSVNGVPPPPSGLDDVPDWAGEDSLAQGEERNWDDEGKLKGVQNNNQILWHRIYGWSVAILIILFVAAFGVSLVIWLIHYLSPWCWLGPDQLSKIQAVLFSGSLGAIATAFVQKQFLK